ncbi:ASCH domain-containing protein [Microcoleus sp.]|uniref:ASCH domain-containing protein n=1 Tax=Microcoleus sp. TaxID=44472 RepID=UPI003523F545
MLATETPKASRTPTTEMGVKEAEEITATIKNGFENLGTKLLEARERKAYKALGYRSFESYCLTEFGKSASSAYRIIENQKVIDELEAEVARQYNELVSLKITGPQVQLLKKLPEVGSRLQAIEFAQKLAKSEERNPTTKHLELAVDRFSNKPEHYRSAIQNIFSQGVRVEVLNTPKTSRGTVRKVDKFGQIYVELDDSGVKPVCFEAHELRALKDSEKPSTPLNDSIASKGDRVVLFAKGLEGRQGEIYTYKTGKKALVVLDGVTLPIDVAYSELELVKETYNTNSDTDKSWDENLVWESGKNTYYYFPNEDKIYSNRWPTGLTLTPYSHRGTPAEFVKNWEERFAGQVVESLVKDSDLNSLLIAQLIALPEQEKESFVSNLFKSLAQFLPTNHAKLESAVDTDAEVEIEKLRRQNQELQEQLVEAESAIVEMVELCQGGIEPQTDGSLSENSHEFKVGDCVYPLASVVESSRSIKSWFDKNGLLDENYNLFGVIEAFYQGTCAVVKPKNGGEVIVIKLEHLEKCSNSGIELIESPQNQLDNPPLHSEEKYFTAITLHQPWASLIAAGKKHYETRSWPTNYRGPIAIHAGKKLEQDQSLLGLLEVPLSSIPLGAIVAIAELTDCILMTKEFILKQSSFEQYLGCWEEGRYAWKLENVRAIGPIPATGKQGLWKWNLDGWNPGDCDIELLESPQNQLDNPLPHSEQKYSEDSWKSVLEANHFCSIEPDDRGEFIEEYRNWNIFFCSPNGEIIAIDLMRTNSFEEMFSYCTEEKWHVPLNKVEEALSFNETLAWTKTVINQVEDFCPGQLSLALETATLETATLETATLETNPEPIELFPQAVLTLVLNKEAEIRKKIENKEYQEPRGKLSKREADAISENRLQRLEESLQELRDFQQLKIGQLVTRRFNSEVKGRIAGFDFSVGGMPLIWVVWQAWQSEDGTESTAEHYPLKSLVVVEE